MDGSVSVVVPTYNETENIPKLAQRLFGLGIPDIRLVIVDDGSPDGTAAVARKLSGRYANRITVIEREGKQGLGTAYIVGFKEALAQGADYVVQMDADLSHSPEYIPDMLRQLDKSDVVVGSRHTQGGGVDADWNLKRRFLSSFANRMIRAVTGLKVKDVTIRIQSVPAERPPAAGPPRVPMQGFRFPDGGCPRMPAQRIQDRGTPNHIQ